MTYEIKNNFHVHLNLHWSSYIEKEQRREKRKQKRRRKTKKKREREIIVKRVSDTRRKQHARYHAAWRGGWMTMFPGRIFIGETSEFGFCQFGDHGWLRGTGQWFRVQLISKGWPSMSRIHTHIYRKTMLYTRQAGEIVSRTRVAPRIIIIFVISWHSTRRAHQSENRINQLSHSRPNSKQEKGGERMGGGEGSGLVLDRAYPRASWNTI